MLTEEDSDCGSVCAGSPFPECTTSPRPPWLRTHSMSCSLMSCSFWNVPGPGCPCATPVSTVLPLCYRPGGLTGLSRWGLPLYQGPREPSLPPSSESHAAAQRQSPRYLTSSQCPPNSPVPKPFPSALLCPEGSGPEITGLLHFGVDSRVGQALTLVPPAAGSGLGCECVLSWWTAGDVGAESTSPVPDAP